MNTKLITALRTTASAIEEETFYYNWSDPCCCNCGSLFSALTGKSSAELRALKPPTKKNGKDDNQADSWQRSIQQHCPITGIPTNELFRELMGYGLTQQDMINLEFLSDKKVLAKMNLEKEVKQEVIIPAETKWFRVIKPEQKKIITKTVSRKLACSSKKDAVDYMRAWADLLTEQGRDDVAKPDAIKAVA